MIRSSAHRAAMLSFAAVAAFVAGALVAPLPVVAQRLASARPYPALVVAAATDSADVARTVERFHEALARGDSAAVLELLAPDAIILESGDSETVAEYRAHHLPADIEFAREVKGAPRTPMRVTVRGDAAWAMGTSTTKGTFRGRAINSAGAELMVLTRSARGWRISAIHWSSRRLTT